MHRAGGDTRALSLDLRKALGGRDCDYPHPVDENAEEQCDVLTWAGTQNYPRLSNLCLQLRHREGNRQRFRTGSRSRGRGDGGPRSLGQLARAPAADPPLGASGAGSSGQPCLTDRVKDGEVLLTKALIFLSLLYAFY